MAKQTWRYTYYYGLQGCYMPDSNGGAYSGTTRRELADLIRATLQLYDMPSSAIRQVKLSNLWHHIKRHGSSSAHFHITDGEHNVLTFSGLTEDEFNEMERDQG